MFKAISLLEYLLKNGIATCVDETRDHIYYLRNLEQFSVMDQGKERGQGVRDKVQVIMAMIEDNTSMQLERQKARRLKKKFASVKSVGSTPAPAPAPAAAPKTGMGFFGSSKAPAPAPSGPSYKVKGGELADIPTAGQVMKPTNSTANKLKSNLSSFGHMVGGVMSSAAASVSSTVAQVTKNEAPQERRMTQLRNFRDLPDDDAPVEEEVQPEPEPEPQPVAAPKPAKPKVTRATKEAQALFNFGDATPMPAPQPAAQPAPVQPAQPAQPAPAVNPTAASLFAQPAPQPAQPAQPAPKKEVDEFDFFSDISSKPLAPAQPAQPAQPASSDPLSGLGLNFNTPVQQQMPMQQQQMAYQQQMYRQQQMPMQQQMSTQQQQMAYQQQMYQQRMYQQQMAYQQQMYQQQQQQQRNGYNMTGF